MDALLTGKAADLALLMLRHDPWVEAALVIAPDLEGSSPNSSLSVLRPLPLRT